MGNCLFLRKGETHTAPISGILASDLAVGSSVYLMENGTATEYLVVHQGLPSSMYDESCNGTWLLRKDIYESRQWHSSDVNDYENSTIHSYLNSTLLSLFDAYIQNIIQQVKIPYRKGSGTATMSSTGANGLSTKLFLLSQLEVSGSATWGPTNEGAKLEFFDSANSRIAYINGVASGWWLRSPYCNADVPDLCTLRVHTDGNPYNADQCSHSLGIRPALILPSNALFDKNTLILKGVA